MNNMEKRDKIRLNYAQGLNVVLFVAWITAFVVLLGKFNVFS